jgi:sulfatase maturation enzyme AslB (radical SAM superfamily)
MSLEVAKECIDWIFNNVPNYAEQIEIDFIGGEPLLEFKLIKQIVNYTRTMYSDKKFIFFATTNGTLLDDESKKWFTSHKDCFVLGLSLDGDKETQDMNRSGSFDLIDIAFFVNNYQTQGIKLTISDFSLPRLAGNIKFLHSVGFHNIRGVNLAEGNKFDWSSNKYIIPLLSGLIIKTPQE